MINSSLSRVSERRWWAFSSTSFWKTRRLRNRHIGWTKRAARLSISTALPSKSSASTWSSSKGKCLTGNSAGTILSRLPLLANRTCPSRTLATICTRLLNQFIWASSQSRAQLRCKMPKTSLRRLKRWPSKARRQLRIWTPRSWVLLHAIATKTKTVSTTCAPTPWRSSSLTSSRKALSRRPCGGLVAIVVRSPRRSRLFKALMPVYTSSVVVGRSQTHLWPSLTPSKSTAIWLCTSESRWRLRGLWRL